MLDIKSLQRNLLGRSDDIYFRGMKIPSLFDYDYKFECLDICSIKYSLPITFTSSIFSKSLNPY